MKTTLHFNLEDPEDKMALNRCIKAEDMYNVLFELSSNLKRNMEAIIEAGENRGNPFTPEDALDLVCQEIQGILEENYINIEELG